METNLRGWFSLGIEPGPKTGGPASFGFPFEAPKRVPTQSQRDIDAWLVMVPRASVEIIQVVLVTDPAQVWSPLEGLGAPESHPLTQKYCKQNMREPQSLVYMGGEVLKLSNFGTPFLEGALLGHQQNKPPTWRGLRGTHMIS